MRILDAGADRAIGEVFLYLTPTEAQWMRNALDDLLAGRARHHVHVNDDKYEHETVLALYTGTNLDEFDERSRRLIIEDQ